LPSPSGGAEYDCRANRRVARRDQKRDRAAERMSHDSHAVDINLWERAQERESGESFVEFVVFQQLELNAIPSADSVRSQGTRHQVAVGGPLPE
jgi:hypothetical protein